MFVLIVGCGRVGSAIAQLMLARGPRGLGPRRGPRGHRAARRGPDRRLGGAGGRFTVGTALEIDALLAAGIEQADAFVASTDGDNTNLVVAQIAKRRFEVEGGRARARPGARQWYAEQGLQTVCPTQTAIEMLEAAVRGQIRFEGVSG